MFMNDADRRTRCECRCGYTCGGPGVCELPVFECLKAGHWKEDCDHSWDGPEVEGETFSTGTCSKCGVWAMSHDMATGP